MNVLVSLAWKTRVVPGPLFFVGLFMAAVGAGLVLYSKSSLDQQLRSEGTLSPARHPFPLNRRPCHRSTDGCGFALSFGPLPLKMVSRQQPRENIGTARCLITSSCATG